MKNQKLIIAMVVSTVFLILVDYLWYAMVMAEATAAMPNMRPQPDMMWMIVSYILFSIAFVHIYSKYGGSGSKMSSGMTFGIWASLLAFVSMDLMWFSLTTTMTLSDTLTDIAYCVVKSIVLGILVAYVTGIPGGDRGKAGDPGPG